MRFLHFLRCQLSEDEILILQEWTGLAMIGRAPAVLVLTGNCPGKTTLSQVLAAVVGRKAALAEAGRLHAARLATELDGAGLLIVRGLPRLDRDLDALARIQAGQAVSRGLYRTLHPDCSVVIQTNEVCLRLEDPGLHAQAIYLTHLCDVAPAALRPGYARELAADVELLRAWGCEGAARYRRQGGFSRGNICRGLAPETPRMRKAV